MTFDEIARCLSASDQKIIGEMMVLFGSVDRQTEAFASQTGLKCKNGCGACCTNPDIETTVTEALPLAVQMWSQKSAQSILEAIRSKSTDSICVFYEAQPNNLNQGRCGIYPYRPGLCRLFGFTARKDKHGKSILVTCKVIKESQAEVCSRTQEELQKENVQAPLLSTYAFAVAHIDPTHGQKLYPINQAIRLALEKVGYSVEKSNSSCLEP